MEACFHHRRFYPLAGSSGDTRSAILFFLLAGVLGAFLTFLSSLTSLSSTLIMLATALGQYGGGRFVPVIQKVILASTFGSLIFSPVFLLTGLFFAAGFTHIFLVMVKGAPRGFACTLRATAYAASPNLIPFVGWLWACVLIVYALAEAHEVPLWKPIWAFTIQLITCLMVISVPLFLVALHILKTIPR